MDTIVIEEIAVVEASAAPVAPVPVHWTPLNRLGFRVAFLYFFIFIFMYGNGSIFEIFPVVGGYFDQSMTWPWQQAALWVGHHIFRITGLAGTFHPTGSGDTALDWVLQLLYVTTAIVGGLIWTAAATLRGNRRAEYQTLYAWLRFGLRLTTGFFMINYGLAKLYPLQMAPISIGILNEPVGQISPMTFLWAMLGLHPGYEMICGAAECIGGILIVFRRTALLGTLISAFVMTNVLLYNLFFDVPVKLFAANLLLALLFIVLPDVGPLFSFFWLHKPAAPVGVWAPPATRKPLRIATRVVEIVFMIGFVIAMPVFMFFSWKDSYDASKVSSPLLGAWHLDAAHPATGAFMTAEGLPSTDLYVDTVHRAFLRSTDLALWRTRLNIDDKAHTIKVSHLGQDPVRYSYQLTDPNHLILVSMPPKPDPKTKPDPKAKPFVAETVTLTRTPVLAHYPLLDRGFHWVNEWGLER